MAPLHQVHLPATGECYLDQRGSERVLLVRWHAAGGAPGGEAAVVLALWRGAECVGTFRLRHEDVASLVAALAAGPVPTTGSDLGATSATR